MSWSQVCQTWTGSEEMKFCSGVCVCVYVFSFAQLCMIPLGQGATEKQIGNYSNSVLSAAENTDSVLSWFHSEATLKS